MYCCSHSGSSTTLPKNSPYANSMATVLTEKLRERNSDRSTIGCSSVSSQMRNTTNPTTATQASATMTVELNQSDRKSTRLNSSHVSISYAVFCLKKKKKSELVTR